MRRSDRNRDARRPGVRNACGEKEPFVFSLTGSVGSENAMQDDDLLTSFERAEIPRSAWNHKMHVRVAWCLIQRYGYRAGLARMRKGITALNRAHGVASTPTGGFHETITVAFFRVIHAVCDRDTPAPDSLSFCDKHLHALGRPSLLRHYSPQHLRSPGARVNFAEPDRLPLPITVGPKRGRRVATPDL